MVNNVIKNGLAIIRSTPKMISFAELCEAAGRPDLVDVPRLKLLREYPVFAELMSIAAKIFARRIESAKDPEDQRAPEPEPAPLTQFLVKGAHYGDDKVRYFYRRPTKGWRWMIADADEVRAWRKQGVKFLPGDKADAIRKRRAA